MKNEDEEKARLLIRMIYRLSLAGIDVNIRDCRGCTPLIIASSNLDQGLMTHIIRIGKLSTLNFTDMYESKMVHNY